MHAAARKYFSLAAVCILTYGISSTDIPWQFSRTLESWLGSYQYLVIAEISSAEFLKPVDIMVLDNERNMHVKCSVNNKERVLERVQLQKRVSPAVLKGRHFLYCIVDTDEKRSQNGIYATDVEKALVLAKLKLKSKNADKNKRILAYSRIYAVWGQERLFRLFAQLIFIVVFCACYQKMIGWKTDFATANQVSKKHPYIVVYAVLLKGLYGLIAGVASGLMFINSPITENVFSSIIYAPITEEILYRCLLFTLVLRYSNIWFATFFISLLFSVAHGYEQLSITIWLFLFALIMQFIYYRYKTITLCIIAHSIGNAAVTVANYYKHDVF